MPVLILNHSDALAQWAADHIPHVRGGDFGPCQAIGVASGSNSEDQLYAVVVFHDYQPRAGTLQFSAAARSPRWATPGVLRGMLAYPFRQLGVFKLWGAIPGDNERALRFNLGIGMRQEATLRHHFGPRRHAVIVSMLRHEYERGRWCDRTVSKEAA
jgi:RimJ/RimL family protein N-acetyltransferase